MTVATPVTTDALTPPGVGRLRLLVGLLQGLLLYGLYRAASAHTWPATAPLLFLALVLAGLTGPVLLVSSMGHLPRRAAILWVVTASAIAAALGVYDGWRQAVEAPNTPAPAAPLVLAVIAGFFIAQSLVLTGYAERRRIASYQGYFEIAWKLGVQLGFSFLFVGATWLVLHLGAALFSLVKLPLFREVIATTWFAIPVTVFAFTAAMHLTDVRPAIVRGIRSLLLMLMGWILPMAALILTGFLVSLPFTGLAPLWATRSASALMLSGVALLVVLINAAWQYGVALPDAPAPIRVSARLACVLLLPTALLAAYALMLRVTEYGWTHDRIVAGACMVIAWCYALGYLRAAVMGPQLAHIAGVNIGTSFVVIAVLVALFSPLANPQRLSVASQMARLDAGKVTAERFDYTYLRFEGGRYGRDALAELGRRTGKDAATIRARVAQALAIKHRWDDVPVETLRYAAGAANVKVWPAGSTLPADFTSQNIQRPSLGRTLPACLIEAAAECDAILLDLVGDGRREIVLIGRSQSGGADVMGRDADGKWTLVGILPFGVAGCSGVRDALAAGTVRAVAPAGKAIDIAGKAVQVSYDVDLTARGCK